jgi:ABC-2 type transport system ATP-binding protein
MENLVCKNICKNYKEKKVLKDVNLTIEYGKIYGMVGRNGAGKTTLLSIMSAQNPATSGEVLLGDEPVWENAKALSHICFSRELSATSGNGANTLKVRDYLKTAAIYYPHWDNAMADRLVELFELDVKKQIGKLSKGMMSMVTIIVAMASKSDFTFLDEPVAGLDVVARDMFYKLLLEEYTESGRTFIISTHIIEEAADIFEEVIVINNKSIMLKENTVDLLERAYHVSGKAEEVDNAVFGKHTYHEEITGRSKSVTVLLEEGQSLASHPDITIQPVTLQNLFVALCGKEDSLHERI